MPARLLPARPDLSQHKKQAKELVKALRSRSADPPELDFEGAAGVGRLDLDKGFWAR